MATEKSPAFQFYPKDFLADERVAAMSPGQRGIYITALCYCWLEGSLPTDPAVLARMLGCAPINFSRMWPRVETCFTRDRNRYTHGRLEKERLVQQKYRAMRSAAGLKRWGKHESDDAEHVLSMSDASANPCSSSSSSSSSAVRNSTSPKSGDENTAEMEKQRWRRALAVAHAVMDDCADRNDWASEMKHRCIVQGIEYARLDSNNQPLYRRALAAAEHMRERRAAVSS